MLLDLALPAVAKGAIVFVCALAISWGLAAGAVGIGRSRGAEKALASTAGANIMPKIRQTDY
jgi:hypothetical protein